LNGSDLEKMESPLMTHLRQLRLMSLVGAKPTFSLAEFLNARHAPSHAGSLMR
jgi:hypothetical protein